MVPSKSDFAYDSDVEMASSPPVMDGDTDSDEDDATPCPCKHVAHETQIDDEPFRTPLILARKNSTRCDAVNRIEDTEENKLNQDTTQ